MARSKKQNRHITVNDVAYSWRAKGNDGFIGLTVWPFELEGPVICATFGYHERSVLDDGGVNRAEEGHMIITNRLVRRVILHAIERFAYNPARKGKLVQIQHVDREINIDDAIRAR